MGKDRYFFSKIFSIPGLWVVQTWPYAFLKILEKKKTVALKFWRRIWTDFLYASIHVFLSMGHGIEEPDFIQYNNNKSFIDEDFSYDF